MEDLKTLLDSLGLEHQETAVYLSALRLGASPASIIAKRCEIPRSTARYTCEQLIKKQLMVESSKGNTKLFTPENPEKLQKLLDMQQEAVNVRQQKLDASLQDLLRLYNPYTVLPKVRFYEGVSGLIEMFEDVLTENKPLFAALSITEDIHPEIIKYANEQYVPRRQELGSPAWAIYNDNKANRDYQQLDDGMNRISLLVPEKDFPFTSCCHIYGNKVAFYSYSSKDMTGVIIENPIIHDTQMSVFKLAWEHAKKFDINQRYSDITLPA